jgi:hypothetical protein
MGVYVDSGRNSFGRMFMCHMMADTVEELHAMADKIGLHRHWFQNKPGSTPHYDVSQTMRERAIKAGAVVISNRQVVDLIQKYRRERNV